MEKLVTTEEAAREFGVSRSTIKRFCDQNSSIVRRTPGGHRRIDYELLSQAMHCRLGNIVRKVNRVLTLDESLSLLVHNDATRLVHLTLQSSRSPADWLSLLEDTIVPALWRVGDLWHKGALTVSDCKIATNTASVVLDALISRTELENVKMTIVGGSLEGSQDTIASKIITMACRVSGIQAIDLGCNCSPKHLAEAQARYAANSLWISHTHIMDLPAIIKQHEELAKLLPGHIPIYVGGGALSPFARRQLERVVYIETVEQMINRLLV